MPPISEHHAGVAGAIAGDVRSQQRVEAQLSAQRFIEHFDFGMHEQHRAMRIGEHVLDQPIAAAGFRIGEAVKEAIALRVFDRVIQVALFLVAKRFAIADEKLKVARVRLIDVRIVNLVDDAVAEREPERGNWYDRPCPRLPSRSKSSAARFRARQTRLNSQVDS